MKPLLFLSIVTFVAGKSNLRYRLTEFDVRLTDGQDEMVYGNKQARRARRARRALGTIEDGGAVGLWRNHYNNGAYEIPIVFDEDDEFEGTNSLSAGDANSILAKLREMEDKLDNVIRFVTVFDKNDFLDGYVRVGSFTSGCWSYVGRLPSLYQPQALNIGLGCDFTDTVEHEFMHTLGFFHEQARPDRDAHVTIHWNNIPTERYTNFQVADNIDSRGSPYDKRSVMHYSNYAFASNPSLPSMSSKDTSEPVLGSAFTMTNTDMVQLRMLYRCQSGTRTFTANCDSMCPCRLDEGTCVNDSGCDGSLACYDGTCRLPTASPTNLPTVSPTTRTPTTVGETFAPTTPAPTTASPTTATPTTASPTITAAPTSGDNSSINIGLVIGLSLMGVGIVIGVLF